MYHLNSNPQTNEGTHEVHIAVPFLRAAKHVASSALLDLVTAFPRDFSCTEMQVCREACGIVKASLCKQEPLLGGEASPDKAVNQGIGKCAIPI